jgi:hypothetical protein
MLRVNTKPRRKNAPRPLEKSAPGYLQWLRGRECACKGLNPHCGGKMQAAHGPDKASKGVATKSRDSAAMPLSELCHLLQHNKGWPWFARNVLRQEPLSVCEAYWRAWPGRIAWERKLSDG